MRKLKSTSCLVLIVVVSIVATSSLFGDDPITQRAPRIAVIDMAQILRGHVRLQQALMNVEEEREEHEASQLQKRRDLDAQIEELNAIESETLEHRLRWQQIEAVVGELETSNKRKLEELADRRARAYYVTYREICEDVREFAERNDIDLVLNYDSSDPDSENPEEILRRLQDGVVYHWRLNITDLTYDIVIRRE